MDRLNYHHLRYFREVARHGHLGRAAEILNVSQSSLSIQIKQLEGSLKVSLFERVGRGLQLTEAGRIALDHAERIFGAGEDLLATLRQSADLHPPLRVGAQSTLSRNFQMQFLRPILAEGRYPLSLKSGSAGTLMRDLETLALDVVLMNQVPEVSPKAGLAAQRIDEQPVALHGRPERLLHADLAMLLQHEPVILPSESVIRSGFEALVGGLGITPSIAAHVDDMAMVRLLAREGVGLAVAPAVVVADELHSGVLRTAAFDLGIAEPFFAITLPRRFPHPALAHLRGDAE